MALKSDLKFLFSSQQAEFLGDEQADGITLTGTNQATGYAITKSINRITGGTVVTAIALVLPSAATFKGSYIAIRSDNIAFAAQLFPAVGEYINGLAINTAFPIVAGTGVVCFKVSTSRWIVMGSNT